MNCLPEYVALILQTAQRESGIKITPEMESEWVILIPDFYGHKRYETVCGIKALHTSWLNEPFKIAVPGRLLDDPSVVGIMREISSQIESHVYDCEEDK